MVLPAKCRWNKYIFESGVNLMTRKPPEKNQNTTEKEQNAAPVPSIRVDIQKLFDGEEKGSLRAVANASIGGAFAIHGIKVYDSAKGLYVAMPTRRITNTYGETSYADTFHPITTEARTALNSTVLKAYSAALAEQQSKEQYAVPPEFDDFTEIPPEPAGLTQNM